MLNISFSSTHPLEKQLSNFNPVPFVFEGVPCSCIEGPLQAFKCIEPSEQLLTCKLSGREAKIIGRQYNSWKKTQILHWKGVIYKRSGKEYQEVLRSSGKERLAHTIGSHDSHQTVLTVTELTSRLYELRNKVDT